MALNLKTLGTRSLSAVFFVIILVSCILYSYFSFLLLFFVVAMLALNEYYRLAQKLNASPFKLIGSLFGILIFSYFFLANFLSNLPFITHTLENGLIAIILLFPFILMMVALFTDNPTILWSVMHTLLGVLYAVLPFGLLISIPWIGKEVSYNYFKILGIIFLIWSNDTLAYLGGSLIGKNKMYERISPGKTWEGTAIGAFGAVGVGFLLNLNHTWAYEWIWPCIGLIVAVLGTIGDLVESMLKRMAGVKDSGQIMPGHGGALDRFDSLIFVTPFVYVFLKLVLV